MTPDEYMAAKTAAIAAAVSATQRTASLFTRVALTPFQWLQLLQLAFPEVERRRREVASLARTFYDTERAKHAPAAPRNDRPLEGTDFQVFVRSMEPARRLMSEAESPQNAVTHFTMRVAREIENAGRNQIIHAIEEDPHLDELIKADEPEIDYTPAITVERDRPAAPVIDLQERRRRDEPPSDPGLVKGWARVATGRETCAWCLMLISRGAELNHKGNFAYGSAQSAGYDLDDETMIDLWNESGHDLEAFREATKDSSQEWHAGCDCVVVPVFDIQDWVGRDAALHAQQLWIDASDEATELIDSGEARSDNKNKETLNALRRRLYRGEITIPSYAHAA